MTEFKALGLVEMEEAQTGSEHVTEITLKPEFKWFLSSQFQKLREGYKPESNKVDNNKDDDDSDKIGSESIYKIYPRKWACKQCKATGDRFFLEDHKCSGKSNGQEGKIV